MANSDGARKRISLTPAPMDSRAAALARELNLMIAAGDLVAIMTEDESAPDGCKFLAVSTGSDRAGLIFAAHLPNFVGPASAGKG